MSQPRFVRVAVPVPLATVLDYRLPPEVGEVQPGVRVRVPFGIGNRYQIGLVMALSAHSEYAHNKIKAIDTLLDEQPILPDADLKLLNWAAQYYHYPIGQVVQTALPVSLNRGEPAQLPSETYWRLTAEGRAFDLDSLKKSAHRQRELLEFLQGYPDGFSQSALRLQLPQCVAPLRKLEDKQLLESYDAPSLPRARDASLCETPLALNEEQAEAVEKVGASLTRYQCFLLDGVTGSGKTEVYLQIIQQVIDAGRQVLLLVPEINLTPQMLARFHRRFAVPMAVLHSRLTDRERLTAWLHARDGLAPIVIGTRSAIWTPLANPGVFIVDEEHDGSYKQQDGFQYSARDLAIMRGHRAAVPVVLGSATPSLDSLFNTQQGRYQLLRLKERAGKAIKPRFQTVDMRRYRSILSPPLVQGIKKRLKLGQQSLVYLNRRGYAPMYLCADCGWVAECPHCSANSTYHDISRRLHCHHCGTVQTPPRQCPTCGGTDLKHRGHGTERVEEKLREEFPEARILRIDSDSTQRKQAMQDMLDKIHAGEVDILVGTQMLTKGHHFPSVTLVGILNVDGGLYGSDFRSGERLAQGILQVAGRAGRAELPGEVLLQTWHPEHPLLLQLLQHGYHAFAESALEERQQAAYPPFAHLALLRAELNDVQALNSFLREAMAQAEVLQQQGFGSNVLLLGPVPAPLERRAGFARAQVLIQAEQRAELHQLLAPWMAQLRSLNVPSQLRWSLDVDPQDLS